jgi:hypothetical protein
MWLCFASAAMPTQYSLQMPTETCRYWQHCFWPPICLLRLLCQQLAIAKLHEHAWLPVILRGWDMWLLSLQGCAVFHSWCAHGVLRGKRCAFFIINIYLSSYSLEMLCRHGYCVWHRQWVVLMVWQHNAPNKAQPDNPMAATHTLHQCQQPTCLLHIWAFMDGPHGTATLYKVDLWLVISN